jgi:hypothetical protein
MNTVEAAHILSKRYQKAERGKEKALSIHLFGIEFASQISYLSARDIIVTAGLHESYKTELRKGINLSEYVRLR